MKTRIVAALFAVAAMLTPACEQQSWKDTSQLFKSGHHDEAHGHGDAHADKAHADDHGKGEAKADAHGEKKAH